MYSIACVQHTLSLVSKDAETHLCCSLPVRARLVKRQKQLSASPDEVHYLDEVLLVQRLGMVEVVVAQYQVILEVITVRVAGAVAKILLTVNQLIQVKTLMSEMKWRTC